jgi:hypothetical protein
MARTRRLRQCTLSPGESQILAFRNSDGRELTVVVSGRNDDGQEVRIVKDDAKWKIAVPPGSSREVDGLLDENGTAVVLRVVVRRPGETATPPEPSDRASETDIAPGAPVFDDSSDVVADVAVDVDSAADFDDRA